MKERKKNKKTKKIKKQKDKNITQHVSERRLKLVRATPIILQKVNGKIIEHTTPKPQPKLIMQDVLGNKQNTQLSVWQKIKNAINNNRGKLGILLGLLGSAGIAYPLKEKIVERIRHQEFINKQLAKEQAKESLQQLYSAQ